jgi:hypothetical protein
MAERECGRVLTDVVVFIAAVEVDGNGHPRHVRFDVLPDLKATRCARPCVRR